MSPVLELNFANTDTTQPGDWWEQNLAALTKAQPQVANKIRPVEIPDTARPAVGRDGTPTWRLLNEEGKLCWFGGTSMPTVSASEILADFGGTSANVALPGILSGIEALVILGKLPRHAALFVVEDDPLQLRLALSLRDYRREIESRRLVFMLGPELSEAWVLLAKREPGFLMPATLITVAQKTPGKIRELQARLEVAAQESAAEQANQITRLAKSIAQAMKNRTTPSTRIAVLGTDPRPHSILFARQLARAVGANGGANKVCLPDTPAGCHLAARIHALADFQANAALLANSSPGPLGSLLPADFPLLLFFWDDDALASASLSAWTPASHVVVGSQSQRMRLLEKGVKPEQVSLGGIAVEESGKNPPPSDGIVLDDELIEVAVIGDLPDTQPESWDITLHSHLAIWESLQEVARESIDRWECVEDGDEACHVEELFALAEERSGVHLQEESLREQFAVLITKCLMPAIRGRVLSETLVACGASVSAWGTHWPKIDDQVTLRGPIPMEELDLIFSRAGVIALLEIRPLSVAMGLQALTALRGVAVRGTCEAFVLEYPYLADVAAHIHFFNGRGQLLRMMNRLRENSSLARDRALAARNAVLSRHTWAHRLRPFVSL